MSGTFWHGIILAKCQAPRAAGTWKIITQWQGVLWDSNKSPIKPFPKYRALCNWEAIPWLVLFAVLVPCRISEYNRQCIWTRQLNHVTYTAWHYSFSLWAQTRRQPLLLTVESVVSPSACIFKQTEVDRQLIRNGCVSLRDSEHNQKVQQVIKEHVTCLLSQCNCYATPIFGYWVKKKSVLVL